MQDLDGHAQGHGGADVWVVDGVPAVGDGGGGRF